VIRPVLDRPERIAISVQRLFELGEPIAGPVVGVRHPPRRSVGPGRRVGDRDQPAEVVIGGAGFARRRSPHGVGRAPGRRGVPLPHGGAVAVGIVIVLVATHQLAGFGEGDDRLHPAVVPVGVAGDDAVGEGDGLHQAVGEVGVSGDPGGGLFTAEAQRAQRIRLDQSRARRIRSRGNVQASGRRRRVPMAGGEQRPGRGRVRPLAARVRPVVR